MSESELEDCFDVDVYNGAIFKNMNHFEIAQDSRVIKKVNKGEGCFPVWRQIWNKETENKVKTIVADCVEAQPLKALNPHKRDSIDSLIRSLENLLEKGSAN